MTLVTTRPAAVVALCAAALVLGTPATAEAKGRTETVRLVPPEHSPDADATGKIKIVQRRKGDKMVIRVKKLAPRTTFDVLDADTDELLGTIRTNKRGRGRLVLSEGTTGRRSKASEVDELPGDVEIVEQGDEVCVLEMEGDPPLFGEERYENDAGYQAWITLISFPAPDLSNLPEPPDRPDMPFMPMPAMDFEMEDLECFILSLVPPPEEGEEHPSVTYELMLDSLSGDEMPLGVPHAADLAERPFEIRAGDGSVWIAGPPPRGRGARVEAAGLPGHAHARHRRHAGPRRSALPRPADRVRHGGGRRHRRTR